MLALAVVMYRSLPTLPPRARASYGALLAAVVQTYVRSSTVRWVGLIGAAAMASFTLFWTALTLLLASPAYGYTTTQIGLVNLVGIFGAVAAQRVGRLYDRGLAIPAIGAGLGVAVLELVVAALGAGSLGAIMVAIAVYSVGVQSVMVLTQTRMLAIDPASRSRLNTVFVVGNFIGGSIGSALASALWHSGGWPATMLAGVAILTIALIAWASQRKALAT